jgi:4'-phosphopantetheinyl transferase
MTEIHINLEIWVFRPGEMDLNPFRTDVARVEHIPDEARRLWAARSRSLLRRVLSLRLGQPPLEIEWKAQPGGKPRTAGCEFSISHSGSWFVVATGEVELGVDVETQMPRHDAMVLARRFYSDDDTAALGGAQNTQREFLTQWVAKEAALKVSGVGLRGLHEARCIFEDGAVCEVVCGDARYAIREFALRDGTPGAIAWPHGPLAEIHWRDAGDLS